MKHKSQYWLNIMKKEIFHISLEKLLYSLIFPVSIFLLDLIVGIFFGTYFSVYFEEYFLQPLLFWPALYLDRIHWSISLLGAVLNIFYFYIIGCILVYLKNKIKRT